MQKESQRHHVAVPKVLVARFRKIQGHYGYDNFSSFAIECIRIQLEKFEQEAEAYYEEVQK